MKKQDDDDRTPNENGERAPGGPARAPTLRIRLPPGLGARPQQITPFLPDPSKFARYQVLQKNPPLEVGFVHVRGLSVTQCTEVWHLYTRAVAGNGESLPDGSRPMRAAYVYPSYQNQDGTQAMDVLTRYRYVGPVADVRAGFGLEEGRDYDELTAEIT